MDDKRYDIKVSVWLAVVIMAYERYMSTHSPTKDMMYFKQSLIRQKAQTISSVKVDQAAISQWYNGNHNQSTYNYMCEEGATRRLSFHGEFNFEKERPDNLYLQDRVQVSNEYKSIQELVGFVEGPYTALYGSQKLSKDIDCISILEYLEQYAGEPYEKLERADLSNKTKLIEIQRAGTAAVQHLDKMAELCESKFQLNKTGQSKWLDGSNQKVRGYLWRQLHVKGNEGPTTLSLFAELTDHRARFRFSVELNEEKSKPEHYTKHHNILNKDIRGASEKLVYIHGGNSSKSIMQELNLSTAELKELIKKGTYKKIQLARVIYREDFNTNEELIEEMLKSIEALLPYYDLVYNNKKTTSVTKGENIESLKEERNNIMNYGNKNKILFGPPGTGKTYHTVLYAVAIIEDKPMSHVYQEDYDAVFERYCEYKTNGKISFTTFHQSYSYEEFIEGIKPRLAMDAEGALDGLEYKIEAGVFKRFCDDAQQFNVQTVSADIRSNPTVWKVSLKGSGQNEVKEDCFTNNRIRIGWDWKDKVLSEESDFKTMKEKSILLYFQHEMKIGDIVLTLLDKEHIDGIGIVTGDAEWLDDGDKYPRSRTVQWIATGIKENIVAMNQGIRLTSSTVYRLKINIASVLQMISRHTANKDVHIEENKDKYVFIIDEINRGNVSKIFGELITLIESTKRLGEKEAITATLPYSGIPFGVPSNIYILGTMNTADRSIALMDTALRRRFEFIEMMPKAEVLSCINLGRIDLKRMLTAINLRIESLYDREHTIGHAYFTPLFQEPSLSKLGDIFMNTIIPLMQEYFYDDYSKIQLVLGDNAKDDPYKFIKDETLKLNDLFKGTVDIDLPETKYSIQKVAFSKEESYIQIYE
ncbi:AAA family ATPase [Paenibacillus sp. OK060]|uniref:AAA family ATPase n=1 Tax=Paenibacillus sp. OK060 TaxID=1881034 RepID=UPI00210E1DFD|nr:AAA family ATPase [Paenibacillus sp. OK060]